VTHWSNVGCARVALVNSKLSASTHRIRKFVQTNDGIKVRFFISCRLVYRSLIFNTSAAADNDRSQKTHINYAEDRLYS
jgi:hypothetical protein